MERTKRIVVVDGEPLMMKRLNAELTKSFDCEVVGFTDSAKAYAFLQTNEVDAISVDHRMPLLTGLGLMQLLRTTRGANTNTPVIILTGRTEVSEPLNTDQLNHVFFIDKKPDSASYIRWMNLVLHGHRP